MKYQLKRNGLTKNEGISIRSNINDEIIPVLVKPLSDKNIKIMDLGGNNLTSKGCEIISENLKIVFKSKIIFPK